MTFIYAIYTCKTCRHRSSCTKLKESPRVGELLTLRCVKGHQNRYRLDEIRIVEIEPDPVFWRSMGLDPGLLKNQML